jgi:hypothetical protein
MDSLVMLDLPWHSWNVHCFKLAVGIASFIELDVRNVTECESSSNQSAGTFVVVYIIDDAGQPYERGQICKRSIVLGV